MSFEIFKGKRRHIRSKLSHRNYQLIRMKNIALYIRQAKLKELLGLTDMGQDK